MNRAARLARLGWGLGLAGWMPDLAQPASPVRCCFYPAKAGLVNEQGWVIELTEPKALAQTPTSQVATRVAPWLRLNWWPEGLDRANCYVKWTTRELAEFSPDRRFYFSPASGLTGKETRTVIPVYRSSAWRGTLTGLCLGFANPGPAKVIVKSLHTASSPGSIPARSLPSTVSAPGRCGQPTGRAGPGSGRPLGCTDSGTHHRSPSATPQSGAAAQVLMHRC